MKRAAPVLLVALLAATASAEELRPGELADRLARARRSAHDAFLGLDSEDEDAVLDGLRKDGERLAGARVKAGDETLEVDPGIAKELARLEEEPTSSGRRDRVARLEKRLAALEREARRAAASAPASDPRPQPGTNQLQPSDARPAPAPADPAGSRQVLEKVLDRPHFKRRAEDVESLGLSEKLESLEQRLVNWWIRFIQPTPALPRPAWLVALLSFIASILPRTAFGWSVVVLIAIGLIALVILWRVGRARKLDEGATSLSLDGGLDGQVVPGRSAAEQSFSEDHWRREARLLAKQGDLRGAIRALYTGVLLSLQRAGRLKFDKGKTNWEHVRELRRNDRALAQRLEPLTRTFDVAWYGQKPVEPEAFESFLAETDAFAAAIGAGAAP